MASAAVINLGKPLDGFLRRALVLGIISLGWYGPTAMAKEPSLTAIELYDGASGSSYIQLADVLINGKAELRSCGEPASTPIDKSMYSHLPKVALGAGGVLERGTDGVLRYGNGAGESSCVVPDNVKFEHNGSYTPAAMADLADLRGRVAAAGSDAAAGLQPLKKGVKLVFVAAPDVEQSEFLLAQRVSTEAGWQNYLAKYPAAAHTSEGKHVLASLYVDGGVTALSNYQKSASTASPSFPDLKHAKAEAVRAHAVLPNSEPEIKLAGEIQNSLAALVAKGQTELEAYNEALTTASPGYVHLQNAGAFAEAISGVDPGYAPGLKFLGEVVQLNNAFEAAVRSAASAAEAKKWDEALKLLQPFRQFAGESPRISQVIDGAYASYYDQGNQLDQAKDWQHSITAYKNALKAKETAEARSLLKSAESQFEATQNETAAKAALEKSKTFELQHEMIPAYEVLTSLSESQQAMVKEDITRLAPDYVTAASQRAKDIAKAYPTIQGIGDEKAVESAYAFLQRANELSTDEAASQAFQSRMQNLGDELSTWFLERAKHSLLRPLGSGTELGWAYLKEAESYKAANLEMVRDQMKMADTAHGMHSRLSIRVQFRDQTSQRQSEGFANQMESAIAAGLDTSGMPVKVVRSADSSHLDVEPDFAIAGDVLEHHISAPPTVESVDSKFINELRTAQAALQGAEAKGNKKEINDLNRQVGLAQKKVEDARTLLDSIAKSKTEDIIRPYTYKKTTYDVVNRVVLQFRIDDTFSGQKGEPVQVSEQDKKQFVVFSDVKPEDANGIKSQGTLPDTTELQTELENTARENLIKKVQGKIVELPHKMYDAGRKKEEEGYSDDAGEAYMRYLNVAPADQLMEREHAQKFLTEQFNFLTFPGMIHEPSRPAPALEQGMATPKN
jgi:hypothetical protein